MYDGAQPWALRRLSAQRSWQLARGYGVTVAVIGSGIDADSGQFATGQVLRGRDLLSAGGRADSDCDGSGTFVAGLVAARPHPATTFVGLAPDARLLPVRVSQSVRGSTDATDPDLLARAIDFAVSEGARVIAVYTATSAPSRRLRKAVAEASDAGAVVVVGSAPDESAGRVSAAPDLCALPGVVAVAAVDGTGAAVPGSCAGPAVDVAAPGAGLVSVSAGATGDIGHVSVGDDAPGYASGYVAAAIALVLSYEPGLSGKGAARRLEQTADRPPNGRRDDQLGWGVVNPYAALSMPMAPRAPAARTAATDGKVIRPLTTQLPRSDRRPLLAAGALIGGACIAVIAVVVMRAGRGRGWRPTRRPFA